VSYAIGAAEDMFPHEITPETRPSPGGGDTRADVSRATVALELPPLELKRLSGGATTSSPNNCGAKDRRSTGDTGGVVR
jgi:hypothetical protein